VVVVGHAASCIGASVLMKHCPARVLFGVISKFHFRRREVVHVFNPATQDSH
jgi:hypothetical protein